MKTPWLKIVRRQITNITGKKERTAKKIISELCFKFNKKPRDLITIYEFCAFTGLKEERTSQFLST